MRDVTLGPRVVAQQRIAAQERHAIQTLLEQSFPFLPADWKPRMFRAIADLLHALTIEDGRRADLMRALDATEKERDAAMTRAAEMLEVIRAIEFPESSFR